MEEKLNKRLMRGEVVSNKMDKTIVVEHTRRYKHAKTGKYMTAIKKYKVHDEHEEAKIGNVIDFYEGRPYSKTKYMYLARVVS